MKTESTGFRKFINKVARFSLWSIGITLFFLLVVILFTDGEDQVATEDEELTFIELFENSVEQDTSEDEEIKEVFLDMATTEAQFLEDLGESYCNAKSEGATEEQIDQEILREIAPSGSAGVAEMSEEEQLRAYVSLMAFYHVRKAAIAHYEDCGK